MDIKKAISSASLIKIVTALPVFATILVGGFLLLEGVKLLLFAAPESIQNYHFGSESMVGVAGWRYLSKNIYVISCFFDGAWLIVFSLVTLIGIARSKWQHSSFGLAMILIYFFLVQWFACNLFGVNLLRRY